MFTLFLTGFFTFLQSAVCLMGYISNNSLFPEPLSTDDETKYLELFKNGNEDARNILIEHNLRLVAHISKKYMASNVEQDDLISIGTIGLIKGINSFDSSKGVRLATYVSRCIDNEILMYLRSTKKLGADLKFKIKQLYEKMSDVLKSREKTILELRFGLGGQKPQTQNEIADSMGISRSYVSRIETKAIGKLAKEIKE